MNSTGAADVHDYSWFTVLYPEVWSSSLNEFERSSGMNSNDGVPLLLSKL